MAILRAEITAIIIQNSAEVAAIKILALLEGKGLALVENGWLDDDGVAIMQIEQIMQDKACPRFGDIPVGTFYIDDGFKRKVSETVARTVDFHNPETYTDDGPTEVDPDLRVYLARGLN